MKRRQLSRKPDDGTGREPRPLQQEAWDVLIEGTKDLRPGVAAAIELYPGAGKSMLIRSLLKQLPTAKALFPTNVLMAQFLESYPDLTWSAGKNYQCGAESMRREWTNPNYRVSNYWKLKPSSKGLYIIDETRAFLSYASSAKTSTLVLPPGVRSKADLIALAKSNLKTTLPPFLAYHEDHDFIFQGKGVTVTPKRPSLSNIFPGATFILFDGTPIPKWVEPRHTYSTGLPEGLTVHKEYVTKGATPLELATAAAMKAKAEKVNTLVHVPVQMLASFVTVFQRSGFMPKVAHANTRASAVEDFKRCGGVLLYAGDPVGLDFPGRMCDHIIIPKIQFANLQDPEVLSTFVHEREEYRERARGWVAQVMLRGVRFPGDTCKVTILDSNFEYL